MNNLVNRWREGIFFFYSRIFIINVEGKRKIESYYLVDFIGEIVVDNVYNGC